MDLKVWKMLPHLFKGFKGRDFNKEQIFKPKPRAKQINWSI